MNVFPYQAKGALLKIFTVLPMLAAPLLFGQNGPPANSSPVVDRPVSWKQLFPNIIDDQKRIWTFPARLARGQDSDSYCCCLGDYRGVDRSGPDRRLLFSQQLSIPQFQ